MKRHRAMCRVVVAYRTTRFASSLMCRRDRFTDRRAPTAGSIEQAALVALDFDFQCRYP